MNRSLFTHYKTFRMNAVVLLASVLGAFGRSTDAADVQYNRDVRPILADKCFRCHGPDAAAREAELRLDTRDSATADRNGDRAIEPGQPARSDLIRRITSTDQDIRMPPPESGSELRPAEIATLRQWIEQGATYQTHWSFVPPRRPTLPNPTLPNVMDQAWASNPIDRFVLARLDREKLVPSVEASPSTLIRRVTLDLTGLPPTPPELDAFEFQFDQNPELAYFRLVDRLLASPRFGEKMAVSWLDAARYADTNGYFTDNDRTMWPWRDWVINALNDNMPFDQFTIEQLAGDLLVKEEGRKRKAADTEAGHDGPLIATGFNRNHMVNNETGIIEEEFRVEYVVDRVDTTATVWMGLTLGCARCHDHKYDPISQKEFYRFFSFFNNVPERGLSGSSGNAAPLLKVVSARQQERLTLLRGKVVAAEQTFSAITKQLDADQAAWESTAIAQLAPPPARGLVAHFPLDADSNNAARGGSVKFVEGMLGQAAKFDGDACLEFSNTADFERDRAFSFGGWVQPKGAGCLISKTDDADGMRGFDVTMRKGKAIVNLVSQWNRNAIQVATVASIPSGQWNHLMVTYDGSSNAAGVRVYSNGKRQLTEVTQDNLSESIRNEQPLRIGRRQASASFKGSIDDVRIYARSLSAEEVFDLAATQLVGGILSRPATKRSATQTRQLRSWFIAHHADDPLAATSQELDRLRSQESQLLKRVPTTMVMQESATPRKTFLLARGQYDQQGEEVAAGVPAFLARTASRTGSAKDEPVPIANRLDMARWLVDPKHPLTARVTVNRLWQQLFGTGLVKTVDDFGTQGDWPSHPELLDWLALELIEHDWDVKHLLRVIVTSHTYRQSSRGDPENFRHDRDNRLLARGPRFRMPAETLRDGALAISGLLAEQLGGPSVKPYQPAGLWEDVTYDSNLAFQQGDASSIYRRSLYTFWKRQAPPPNMLVFDAPTRETCTVQRSRTNTPLQALVLMNDPTFVEASRKLAERMMTEVSAGPQERIIFAFRSATARRPNAGEMAVLLDVFHNQLQSFKNDTSASMKLLTVGESKRNESLDAAELATWTTVASMILSLDETITRE